MSALNLHELKALPKVEQVMALAEINTQLEKLSAQERVRWALEHLPAEFALSSSFGIQAAVSLHLVTRELPDIPVILTDTGYLFPETYQFIDTLHEKLNLNLKVYRAEQSAAWQEARYGKLWEQGVEGIERYNDINKVEPMNRALRELGRKRGLLACGASNQAAVRIYRCSRFSAGCLKYCRLSIGIISRFINTYSSMGSAITRCGSKVICPWVILTLRVNGSREWRKKKRDSLG